MAVVTGAVAVLDTLQHTKSPTVALGETQIIASSVLDTSYGRGEQGNVTGEVVPTETRAMGTETMSKMKNIMLMMGLIIPQEEKGHNHQTGTTTALLLLCV